MKNCPTCQASYPVTFAVCPQDGTPLIEVGAWSPGSVVRGKYRILSKVGQGGFGAVYKALHVNFDELRAIKVINKEYLHDQLFVKRFKHEAVITRKLQHPNAVRVDDIDESEDGMPFIVMEFIEGQSLRKLIETEGAQPVNRVCSIIKQSAAALDASHRLGMVHRDIKPDNIVLVETPEGEQAKVLDFGIAKVKEARGEAGGMTLTGTGVVIGTPQYMSPEQAMGKRGDQLDGRSDLYSLGIVMYQMLTGELPFKADTTMEMLIAHVQQPPIDVCNVHPELQIPDAVAHVAMRLLEKKPENRPDTGQALIEEIERAEEAATSTGMSETHVISPVDFVEQPINLPPPPPPPRPVQRAGRATPAQTAQTTAPQRRVATPPPAPPREIPPVRPAPPPPAPFRVVPQIAPAPRKPSQAGIWAALGILVVGLAGGVWYYTEHRTVPDEPVPAPAPAPDLGKSTDTGLKTEPAPNPLDNPPPKDSSESGTVTRNPLETGGVTPPVPKTTTTTVRREEPARRRTPDFVQPRTTITPPKPKPAPEPTQPAVDARRVNAALKMGDFYFERGEYEKAIEEFEQGLSLDPSNRDLRTRVARARRAKAAEDLLNQ